ncbi:MAG: hypothetical protein DHS20C12_06460 [Pseudohongiella sp.]|nr:MAG: hypothetical protein DHS20C12_06460 [Pseudohongiella sp.]
MSVFIKEIMSSEVTTIPYDSIVENAECTMLTTNRRCVPVIEESGNCVGVLSHSDILSARSAKIDVSTILVEDIMSKNIMSVSPHCSIGDAMELMIDHGMHHVLVIMCDKVIGIVSVIDIIKASKSRAIDLFSNADSFAVSSH